MYFVFFWVEISLGGNPHLFWSCKKLIEIHFITVMSDLLNISVGTNFNFDIFLKHILDLG